MNLYAKTIGAWLLMCFVYVVVPFLWVYDLFFNEGKLVITKIEIMEQIDNFFDFLLAIPIGLIVMLFVLSPVFYVMEFAVDGLGMYRKLSFSYLKTLIHLTNRDMFYSKLLAILDELFESGVYKNKHKQYTVEYGWFDNAEKRVQIHFHDETLNTILFFEFSKRRLFIKKDRNGTILSEELDLKKHDAVMHQQYYRELVTYCTEAMNKQQEKEQIMHEKEMAKQEAHAKKERMQEEERFEKMFSTLTLMKKRGMSYSEVVLEDKTYAMKIDKRSIVVSNNEGVVFLKCTVVASNPVVYVHNKTNESNHYVKVVELYKGFLSKTERPD